MGELTSFQMYHAMALGYSLLKIYEVWHYRERGGHLFKAYIEKFFKIKEEATGWPKRCDTETKKQQFLVDFERDNNIRLEYGKMI